MLQQINHAGRLYHGIRFKHENNYYFLAAIYAYNDQERLFRESGRRWEGCCLIDTLPIAVIDRYRKVIAQSYNKSEKKNAFPKVSDLQS
jgi:hypothetical protein